MNDLIKILLQAEVDAKSISNIKSQMNKIQDEIRPINVNINSSDAVKSIKDIEGITTKIDAVNKKTWENASGEVVKYTQTLKNLEKGLTIVDSYMKNKDGGFDFTGRTINDKSLEMSFKTIQKAHAEALKMNGAMDTLISKNRQMAKDSAWKQYFQGISETSREIVQLNQYYSQLASGGMEQAHTQAIKMNKEFDKLEQVTKRTLSLDVDKMGNKYKNLVSTDSVNNIKSMIESLKFDDPNLGQNIDLIKLKMKEVSTGAEQSRKSLDLANKSSMSFGEAIKTAAYKFGIWSVITASYFKVIREISTGVKFITEMDSALTEIGMVTNQNREQTAGLAKEYNNLAKEMKVLTSDITSGAVGFYRQGLAQEEVMERLKVTTMYSKVANIEFEQSAELLTATVNSMGVSIEHAADVFLMLGDATATSGEEVGRGFSKTSGSAAALGLEFEKVASWIAHVSAKTRDSAESIGTSMNTIISRMSRMTETGFNEEDETQINDVAKALNEVGIALMDETGSFWNFGDVLDDVGGKWDTLEPKQQAYIANTIAGVRQQSKFYNLMNDYADSVELYEGSLDAAGTAQSKFNLYLESNQATLDTFRTTLEGLWITVLDSDSLMTAVKMFTAFFEVLDNMVEKFGTFNTALMIIIPLVGVKLALSFRQAYVEMVKLIAAGGAKEVLATSGIFNKWALSLIGVDGAAKGATMSMTGLTAATALATAGLVLIPVLIGAIASAETRRKKAIEESIEAYDRQKSISKDLDELVISYERLAKSTNLTAQEQQELLEIKEKIKKILPESASLLDSETISIENQAKAIKNLSERELELLKIRATDDIIKYGKKYEKVTKDIEANEKALKKYKESMADLVQIQSTRGLTSDEETRFQTLKRSVEILEDSLEKNKDIINTVDNAYDILNGTLDVTTGETKKVKSATDNAGESFYAMSQSIEGLYKQVSTAVDEYDLFNQALKELNDEGRVSKSTLDKLIEIYPDIIQLTGLQKDKMIELMTVSKDKRRQMIDDEIATAKASSEATVQKILDVKDYADALTKLAQLKAGMALFDAGGSSGDAALDARLQADYDRAKQALDIIEQTNKKIQSLEGMRSLFDGVDSKYKPKGGSSSSKDAYGAMADRYAQINLLLDKNNVLMAKNRTEQSLTGDDITKKIKLMEDEMTLYKDRQKLLNQLNIERRNRGKELQNQLQSDGFKFEGNWNDNSIMITNLEAIAGKGKAVEERYKEILSIMKELPSASQEWLDIQVKNKELAEKIKQEYKNELSERLSNSKNWIEKRNFYDDWGADNEIAAWERVRTYIEQYYNRGIISHKEYSDHILDIDRSVAAEQQRILAEREKLVQEHIKKLNDAYSKQQDQLSKLEAIQERLVQIIRKRGEEEKKLLDESHKTEMDSLEKRHNERKSKYQEEVDLFKKMIQDKISALDEQYEEEDYLEQLNKEREQANELQKQIDVLSLDDSLTAKNKVTDLRKQLAEQNEKIAKMQQKKERDLLKKSLQDQLKDREQDAKDKDEIADNTYENEKKRLEEDYKISKEFLDKKYADDQVYAEAKEAILRNQVEVSEGVFMDIYSAFVDFEDKFGKGLGILGNLIKEEFHVNLKEAQRLLQETANLSQKLLSKPNSDRDYSDDEIGWKDPNPNNPTGGGNGNSNTSGSESSFTDDDYFQYIKNKKDYDNAKKNGDTAKMRAVNQANQRTRDRLGIASDDYTYSQIASTSINDFKRRYGLFKQGGETQRTGMHWIDGEEGKPERVLSAHQTKDFNKLVEVLSSDSFKHNLQSMTNPLLGSVKSSTPSISNVQKSELKIEKLINIEGNVTKETIPLIKQATNDITETLKNLNKSGIFRPAKG